jgi:CheY-like chemotaxis protein
LDTFLALRRDADLKAVPVVFVTAFHDGPSGESLARLSKSRQFQPDAFLEKPVDPEDLLAVVEEVVVGG